MKLEKNIRRELEIGGNSYIVWVGPEGLLFKQKRKRTGKKLNWEELLKHTQAEGLDCKELDGSADSDSD